MQNSASASSLETIGTPPEPKSLASPTLIYSSPGPARDAAWLNYLRSLRVRGVLSQLVANNAEQLWRLLRSLASNAAIPEAAVTDDGGLFMSWDRGVHHLEVEILPEGKYEWFYRNRQTDSFGGDYNYPASALAPELLAQFRLIAEQ